ncbi:AbrB/MazE/SpoVT family DNA-binding domain-containing protein [Candidatus Bathyarchaeota archaeon]|nr:AbrB/MazE/SpoVT family DNA-binding domain-containing protein [Candidatus Bathyarchaeota archaeon]
MVEKVNIDERGRITIPKSIRDRHNFIPGEEFEILDENDQLIIKILVPEQKTVKSSKNWGKNTFLKAGESTFGD